MKFFLLSFIRNKLRTKNESAVCIRRGKRLAPWCDGRVPRIDYTCRCLVWVVCCKIIMPRCGESCALQKYCAMVWMVLTHSRGHLTWHHECCWFKYVGSRFFFFFVKIKKEILPTYNLIEPSQNKKTSWVEPVKSLEAWSKSVSMSVAPYLGWLLWLLHSQFTRGLVYVY